MTNKAYENLTNAIILQAVDDYRKLIREDLDTQYIKRNTIKEIEEFFLSEWFSMLAKADGKTILNRLKKEYKDECKANTTNR